MANIMDIEQTARFYRTWETRHVQDAVESLNFRHEPYLSRELDEWCEGLQQFGWAPQKASDFVSDMRLWMRKRRIRGPHWRLD